jgi:hypothetical protein
MKKLLAILTSFLIISCATMQPWESVKPGAGYCTDVAKQKLPYACADLENDTTGGMGLLDIYKFKMHGVVYIMAKMDERPFNGQCDAVFVVFEVPCQTKTRHGFKDAPLVAPVGSFACEEWDTMVEMHKEVVQEQKKDGI